MDEVLKNLIYFSIGSGILAFLIKTIIKHFLNKDFEKFKLELNQLHETNRIIFNKLHEERAEVIKNVYQKLDILIDSAQSLINPIQWSNERSIDDKKNITQQNADAFIRYYSEKKIFFPSIICSLIDEIIKNIKESFRNYKQKELLNKSTNYGGDDPINYWVHAWDKVSKEIPKVQNELADEFRKILGVKS